MYHGRGAFYQYDNYGSFDMEAYVKETGEKAAPLHCFKQRMDTPENEFKIGIKLEASDPRNITSICIATVVKIHGPRLGLRLDGSDDRNDFWRLVDSSDLHPIGFSEKNGVLLQPPLGFSKNPSCWRLFLQKTIATATPAPESCFKKEPPSPTANFFKEGMKLEAVDHKNPHLICPATVGEVNGDRIHVVFDGWKGAFDYTCQYDSRDIFPVGWCRRNNHPLQPPGNKDKGKKGRKMTSKERLSCPFDDVVLKRNLSAPLVSSSSKSNTDNNKTPNGSTDIAMNIKKETADNSAPEPDTSSAPLKSPQTPKDSIITVYVNHACFCGSTLVPSLVRSDMPSVFGPTHIKRGLQLVLQCLLACSKDQGVIYNLLESGNGRVVITARVDGEIKLKKLKVIRKSTTCYMFLHYLLSRIGCCPGLLTSQKTVGRCSLCNNANDLGTGGYNANNSNNNNNNNNNNNINNVNFTNAQNKNDDSFNNNIVASSNMAYNSTPHQNIPHQPLISGVSPISVTPINYNNNNNSYNNNNNYMQASKVVRPQPQSNNSNRSTTTTITATATTNVNNNNNNTKANNSGNKITTCTNPTNRVQATKRSSVDHTSTDFSSSKVAKVSNVLEIEASSTTEARSHSTDANNWSIEDVIAYVSETDSALLPFIDLFRKHEIDGKALMLLTSEMMMRYMGMKLGPALKLCHVIERLKVVKMERMVM